VPRRGTYMGSSHVTESVVSQILTELDGLEELKDVTVIGATNRPDMLDPALMRPGRMERHIYVPPPDEQSRRKIFDVYLRQAEALLTAEVKIDDLVAETDHYVGADIEALVREAKLAAMREFIVAMAGKGEDEIADAVINVRLTRKHFDEAKMKVKASLDRDALETAERQAWEMLYTQDQREILEEALGAVKRVSLRREEKPDTMALETLVFSRAKDWNEIKRLTHQLEEELKRTAT
jgi:transitional endoplasmic reticulum ATPase